MGFLRRLFGPKRAKDKKKRASSSAGDEPEIPAHFDSAFGSSALDANKHAIAVAAATAAVAEAALAAAHAAAEVVRLTNGAGASSASSAAAVTRSRYLAAVVIQSAFRGYLARRALRALKALVKLQALARGNIVRKQTADMLRRMQTLVRVQARARASRTHLSESSKISRKSSLPNQPFPESADRNGRQKRAHCIKYDGPSVLKRSGSNANFRDAIHKPDKPKTTTTTGSNWLDRWMEESVWNDNNNNNDDDKSDKILEVDTWKPHLDPQRSTRSLQMPRNVLSSDYYNPGFAQFNSPSKRSTSRPLDESPRAFSASSRPSSSGGKRVPFTPAKSDRSWGYFSAYSGYYPNYMANTESSRAKVRSQSAPRQRIELEKYGASKRSAQGYWDGWTHSGSNNDDADLRGSVVYPSFNNHLDRLGSASLR